MKVKNLNVLVLSVSLGLITSLNSCNEREQESIDVPFNTEVLSKSAVKKASLDKQLEYKRYYLEEAVKTLKLIGVSPLDIINQSSKGIQKNTATIGDLFNNTTSLKKGVKNSDLDTKFEELNNAFKGLEDRDFNISFYVPFAEKLTASETKKLNNEQAIFIFEELEDPNKLEYEGYLMNEDGTLVSYNKLISEEIAEALAEKGTPVVVVGLQDANLYADANGQTYSSASNANRKSLWISNLVVKSHKESWVGGASEIAIQMYKYENANLQKINFKGYEYEFAKVKRRNIRRKREAPIHSPQLTAWIDTNPIVFNHSKFFYVIYEADNFPTGRRDVHFTKYDGNNNLTITFRSADSEYYNSNTHNNKIVNFVENGEIRFRTQLR